MSDPVRSRDSVGRRPPFSAWLLAAAVVLGAPNTALWARDLDRSRIEDQVERVYRRESIQDSLPAARPESSEESSSSRSSSRSADDESVGEGGSGGGGAGSISSRGGAEAILWILGGIGAMALVLIVASMISSRRDRKRMAPPKTTAAPKLTVSDAPRQRAESIAAGEDLLGAIRALLAETLRELSQQTRYLPPVSLTSREILARAPLSDPARDALGLLVGAVERHHFGGEAPARADYESALDAFERFRASCGEAA